MTHPCHAPRDPLKGAALADRQSRIGGALEACGQGGFLPSWQQVHKFPWGWP